MSEVIQPAPGQTVITTDHDHHHRHHDGGHHDGRHGFDAVEARADFRSLTAEVERFGTLNGDRVKDGFSIAGDRINAVGSAGQLAACRTDSLVQGGFGGVHDRLCDATGKIVGAVALVDKNAVTLAKDNVIAMNVGFNAQTVQSERIGSAAQVLATAFANQAQNTATMYANAATVQVERVRAELALQAQENASAQALAMCKCCGELQAQADRNLAAITATSVAGTQRILDRMCDDKNADLRAQLVATQRLIPVTIAVGA